MKFLVDNFEASFTDWQLKYFLWNCPQMTALDLAGNNSTLVQVMAWCRQATIHYLGQWWPGFISQYSVTRPQWVNSKSAVVQVLSNALAVNRQQTITWTNDGQDGHFWLILFMTGDWPWPWIFKVKIWLATSQGKMLGLPQNKIQTYPLNARPEMWPSILTLDMTLTLDFQGQIFSMLYLRKIGDWLPQNKKANIDWALKCTRPQFPSNVVISLDFGHGLDLSQVMLLMSQI